MSKSTPKKPNTPTQIEWAPIESVTPYARNPRKIGADAVSAVSGSIKEFGFKSPIIVDNDRVIINGHTRLKAAQQLGLKEVPIVVASDLTPEQVRAYRIADNRSAEFSKWDEDFLKVELDDIGDIDLSFCNVDEMLAEIEEQSNQERQEQITEGEKYTSKIDAPMYEPKGENPKISELYSIEKSKTFIERIKEQKLEQELEEFLIYAAHRHNVFNYGKIAEFYCHASKETQEIMEDLALIIVDYKKALKMGYAKVSKELDEVFLSEESEKEVGK